MSLSPDDFELANDAVDNALDPLLLDRPFAQCYADRAGELIAVERNAPAVGLHHGKFTQLGAFDGGEALAAIGAEAAAPDCAAVLRGARVLHLRVLVAAEWAAHGGLSSPVQREARAQRLHACADRRLGHSIGAVVGVGQAFEHFVDHQPDLAKFCRAEAA